MKRRTTVIISAAVALAISGAVVQSLAGHAETPSPGTTSTTVSASSTATTSLAKTTRFYVDPKSGPAQWVAAHPHDGRTATIKAGISSRPMARWFGDWSGKIGPAVKKYTKAAAKKKRTPILVAYNLPGRDACGQESAGGAGTASKYRTWVKAFAGGIGTRKALVILEPDSLADLSCLTSAGASTREKLLTYATKQFRAEAPNALIYLDAGNSHYASATVISKRLVAAGVKNVHGFSLNVSNFHTTADENAFAAKVNAALRKRGASTKPYVVDTSRNGNGSNGQWCNPAGRRIGHVSAVTKQPKATKPEAVLWVKAPGQSDGTCGIAPDTAAGTFDPQIAYDLVLGH